MHVLKPRRGQRFPDVVVGMASDLTIGEPSIKLGVMPIIATSCALAWRVSRIGQPDKRGSVICSPGQALDVLKNMLKKHRCVWLWGPDLYRQFLAIGLFDQIGPGKPFTLGESHEQETHGDDQESGAHPLPGSAPGKTQRGHKRKNWSGFAVLEGRITILVIRLRGGGILHACDIKNIGLAGAPRLARSVTDRAVWTRNAVDGWIDWLRRNDMGTLQHTISSQAFYGFRRHLPEIPVLVHDHIPALGVERGALHGGRCEAFRLGRIKGPIYQLDFASLYGACAANNDMPIILNSYQEWPVQMPKVKGIDYIADVDVWTNDPCIPFRDLDAGLLTFPIGKFRAVLCGPELEIAWPAIRHVYRVAAYQMGPLFHIWARRAWESRIDADRAEARDLAGQLKLFGQVLYGKFGQQRMGWRRVKTKAPPAPWSAWSQLNKESGAVDEFRSIAGRTECLFRGGETYDSCPAISAWVASLARRALWDAMSTIGRENVYYVDTDSIWTNAVGYARAVDSGLVRSAALGSLRLVRCHRWVEFRGWKHYLTPVGLTCAGVSAGQVGGVGGNAHPTVAEPITAACRNKRAPRAIELRSAGDRETIYRHGVVVDGTVYPFVRKDW